MSTTMTPIAPSTRERIFAFITQYILEHQGRSPTVREIGSAFDLVKSNVLHHLNHLQHEGRISVSPGARGIGVKDVLMARVLYGNDERLRVQVICDGVEFVGFVHRKEIEG